MKPKLLVLCFFYGLSLFAVDAFANERNEVNKARETSRPLYGLYEQLLLLDFDQQLEAKIDTGAQTSSLHAHNIKRFRRGGKSWVRFYLAVEGATPIERPLLRISRIKRRADDFNPAENKPAISRPVIELDICLGNSEQRIEVNLTDRSAFRYPFLLGSDALRQFAALVDPALEYVAGKPSCPIIPPPAE